MSTTWIILLAVIVAFIGYTVWMYFYQKKLIKTLTEEEFRAGYRKAQLIDIRETDEYNAGHILGARNIPLSQIRLRHKELRQDQPVYLYCQSGFRTGRAAQYLKKQGYKDFYQLQGGFKSWTGKIKKK
ncbi:rhodanese-like domain-containing protein [Bacillus thuringiensis]|uniref:Rhodanese-like domain-containing protein n=10 Tax=Bacillus cereus group TaxID=86661 RepID=A0A150DIK2_BACCE|nr:MULTISPECIES: rhodanese-like domain-containing protein [Bacillus]EEM40187.1 Rhodanese-related sulfurtransferase [Bacillus thuringiensis serovar sotto str. T04001]MBK5493692.1 rhodanese-like domain-containing protein [Bacillus sp. TH13]MBS9804256.1 rhodanese-like domain-containing protein [Bacillus toyonensis]MCP1320043.1 rhodanese-like domain-containing protein [Bacillus sp. S0628]MED1153346.1 rhodanese-like domain-containing protein [Bacillus paranthracis]NYS74363.1 rhodanese-like domain-